MTSTDPQNPYADAHKDPQGVDDARPTAIQVIKDLDLVNNIAGKIILVTGSSSGIGIETVRALHLTGADVYMQVRNLEKGEKVRTEILSSSEGHGKLEIVKMDLDSFASIREGANDFLSQTNKLNILINNAGKLPPPCNACPQNSSLQASVTPPKAAQSTVTKRNSQSTICLTSSFSNSCSPHCSNPAPQPSTPASSTSHPAPTAAPKSTSPTPTPKASTTRAPPTPSPRPQTSSWQTTSTASTAPRGSTVCPYTLAPS